MTNNEDEATAKRKRHRVLVVDDSAFARKVMREVLSNDKRLDVIGFACDGLDALEKIAELKPDVITLDLVMPELDGVGVLEALKAQANPPRVIVVTMTDADSVLGLAALEAGAVDIVHKPTALATDRLYELEKELVEKVVAAATSKRVLPLVAPPHAKANALPPAVSLVREKTRVRLVVIGASTGGPRALTEILNGLPATFPVPIAAVVHMPPGYTHAFAARLNASSALRVVEASNGFALEAGTVAIARAGMHLVVRRADQDAVILGLESMTPLYAPHCPSVDVLFDSAAKVIGADVLAVVLTGMGSDGLVGARALKAVNARLLVESESSCVVYGMPRAIAEADLGADSAPLELMIQSILDHLG